MRKNLRGRSCRGRKGCQKKSLRRDNKEGTIVKKNKVSAISTGTFS
jgi:hypothetical protein